VTKIEVFTSKKEVIIKYINFSLPDLSLTYGVAETKFITDDGLSLGYC
jgi:hypothetical protein